jgi:hypothetical protein
VAATHAGYKENNAGKLTELLKNSEPENKHIQSCVKDYTVKKHVHIFVCP